MRQLKEMRLACSVDPEADYLDTQHWVRPQQVFVYVGRHGGSGHCVVLSKAGARRLRDWLTRFLKAKKRGPSAPKAKKGSRR